MAVRPGRTDTVDLSSDEVETELVDLSHHSPAMLRDCDRAQLSHSLRRLKEQIVTARANLGSSGPPGRVN